MNFDWKRYGLEKKVDTTEVDRSFIEHAVKVMKEVKDRTDRIMAGCPTEEDKKWLAEANDYCHECGRKYDSEET